MSEPKFYKGEWKLLDDGYSQAIQLQPGKIIPVGDPYIPYEGDQGPVIEENRANARLMVKGPEMYKALEENAKFLRDAAKWLGERGMADTPVSASMLERADDIGKLLGQARGEKE